MFETTPENTAEQEPTTKDIDTALRTAQETLDQIAPGVQEKRLALEEQTEILKNKYELCITIVETCQENFRSLMDENTYEKNKEKIKQSMDKSSEFLSLAQQCVEMTKTLEVEQVKYSDLFLGWDKETHRVISAGLGDMPKLIQYCRDGIGEIEDVRKILSNLEDYKTFYEAMTPEIQNLYLTEKIKVDSLIQETKDVIQARAGVRYKEGIGLVIDKEIK